MKYGAGEEIHGILPETEIRYGEAAFASQPETGSPTESGLQTVPLFDHFNR